VHTESNSQPIATVEEFQRALLRVRDDKLQALDLPILRAFCGAPSNILTATKLAEVVGLSSWNESNLRFGMLAQRIGKALGYRPTTRKDGSTRWWESAALGSTADETDAANFQWTLRPELVDALRRMRWV
jgi:predicted HNH restriction endonuclease